jgi:hypothetical protein
MRIGQVVRASTLVTLGRGGVEALTSGWRSDHPAVATVTDGGVVTGASTGRATIYVSYGGVKRAQEIRVVPDFEGQWTGTYRITRCTPFPNEMFRRTWCDPLDGVVSGVTFTLTQKDEFVTGTFVVEGITYPGFVSSIDEGGLLGIASAAVTARGTQTATSWSVSAYQRGRMEGILTWVRSSFDGANGTGIAEGTVVATH